MGWRHPAPDTGSSDGDLAVELLSEIIMYVVVGRVTFEVQGDEKLGLRRSRLFSKRRRRSTLC